MSILPSGPDSNKAAPSEAERRTATLLMTRFYATDDLQIAAVAQALADQRAKYEAVADELERQLVLGAGVTAARHIRAVAR